MGDLQLALRGTLDEYQFTRRNIDVGVFACRADGTPVSGIRLPLTASLVFADAADTEVQGPTGDAVLETVVAQGGPLEIAETGRCELFARILHPSMDFSNRQFRLRFACTHPRVANSPVLSSPFTAVNFRLYIAAPVPEIWYKEEGGKDHAIALKVECRGPDGGLVAGRAVRVVPALHYEDRSAVTKPDVFRIAGEEVKALVGGEAHIAVRIESVSRNHEGRKFRVAIRPEQSNLTNLDVAPAWSTPIDVRSKRNKPSGRGGRGRGRSGRGRQAATEIGPVPGVHETPALPTTDGSLAADAALVAQYAQSLEEQLRAVTAFVSAHATAAHGAMARLAARAPSGSTPQVPLPSSALAAAPVPIPASASAVPASAAAPQFPQQHAPQRGRSRPLVASASMQAPPPPVAVPAFPVPRTGPAVSMPGADMRAPPASMPSAVPSAVPSLPGGTGTNVETQAAESLAAMSGQAQPAGMSAGLPPRPPLDRAMSLEVGPTELERLTSTGSLLGARSTSVLTSLDDGPTEADVATVLEEAVRVGNFEGLPAFNAGKSYIGLFVLTGATTVFMPAAPGIAGAQEMEERLQAGDGRKRATRSRPFDPSRAEEHRRALAGLFSKPSVPPRPLRARRSSTRLEG